MAETAKHIVTPWFNTAWECGPLVMNHLTSRAALFGVDLQLSEQQYSALFLLAQRPGEIVSLQMLHQAVWALPNTMAASMLAKKDMRIIMRKVNAHGRRAMTVVCEPGGYRLYSGR